MAAVQVNSAEEEGTITGAAMTLPPWAFNVISSPHAKQRAPVSASAR
jgi:hypothetical protein